jgi:hypothetical protein
MIISEKGAAAYGLVYRSDFLCATGGCSSPGKKVGGKLANTKGPRVADAAWGG